MVTAILLAAGKSSRFLKRQNKLFAPILGKPLLYYSLQAIHDHPQIDEVYVVTGAQSKKAVQKLLLRYHFRKVKKIVAGGKERQDSLAKCFAFLKPKKDHIVLVHNGANPLVGDEEISAVLAGVKKTGAAAAGRPVVDTIKEIRGGHFVKTHAREKLVGMQTPQAARYDLFKKALAKAKKQHRLFSDETSLLENAGVKVQCVRAAPHNFKITTWHDYGHLKFIMGDTPKDFLIGLGQDSHEFTKQIGLTLGGIFFADMPKLKADSDGDVILHALCNAIAQALAENSLGDFATPLFREKRITDSKKYLKLILQKMKKRAYELNNLGLMIEGSKPKIDPIAPALKKSLHALLKLEPARIGITATTGENLSPFGLGRGLQCFAIVSLKKHENTKT